MRDRVADPAPIPGPAPSLEEVFRELAPALVAWAAIRIPDQARRHVAPEDVAQEVWLRATRIYSTSFDPRRSSPRAWMFAVAKNVLLEVQRAAARLRPEQGADGRTTRCLSLAEVPASITSLTTRLARDDAVHQFLERVGALADEDRRLLVHCGMEELPLREAAERLGITSEAATKRWQRLRAHVAEWRVSANLLAV